MKQKTAFGNLGRRTAERELDSGRPTDMGRYLIPDSRVPSYLPESHSYSPESNRTSFQPIGVSPADQKLEEMSQDVGETLETSYFEQHILDQQKIEALEKRVKEIELQKMQSDYDATHDGLTGLLNKTMFDNNLNTTLNNQRRRDYGSNRAPDRISRDVKSFSILYIDIDHFKNMNDTNGHPAGDRVLSAVAKTLQKHSRNGQNHSYRIGGEEMAVLIQDSDLFDAATAAERLRRAVYDETSRQGLGVTVSIGIANYNSHSVQTSKDMINKADSALYAAKNLGRNRIAAYTNEQEDKENVKKLFSRYEAIYKSRIITGT
jgi:diguanylate cyclase (GGDEF)-like protein